MDNETLIEELILKIESILTGSHVSSERRTKLDHLKAIFLRSECCSENKINALARATRQGIITLTEANHIW